MRGLGNLNSIFILLILMAGLWSVNASGTYFGVGSFHQGLAGANETGTYFNARTTQTYQQPSNQNATSFHFFGNIGWFKINITAPTAITELIQIAITYPYTGSTLGMEVSNCHLIISIETNATNASTISQNISLYTTNGSGIYALMNSYQSTDLNHSFNITLPVNMVNNSIRINGTSRTIGTINYTNNVSATIVGTTFCTGGTNAPSLGSAGSIIWIFMFLLLIALYFTNLNKVVLTWFGNGLILMASTYAVSLARESNPELVDIFTFIFIAFLLAFGVFSLFIFLDVLYMFIAKLLHRKHRPLLFASLET